MLFRSIQMDNLLYLYAEFLNPERVLDKVYNKDKKLADIRIADKPIKQKELLQRLEERFNGVSDIWARYCNFIHPSICHHKIKFNVGRDSVISDMIFINQAITEILEDVASPLEKELKKKRLYSKYKRNLQEEISKYIYFTKEDEGIE